MKKNQIVETTTQSYCQRCGEKLVRRLTPTKLFKYLSNGKRAYKLEIICPNKKWWFDLHTRDIPYLDGAPNNIVSLDK